MAKRCSAFIVSGKLRFNNCGVTKCNNLLKDAKVNLLYLKTGLRL